MDKWKSISKRNKFFIAVGVLAVIAIINWLV